jgi:hypothetical protein
MVLNLRWAALCPMVPACGWRDDGYTDERLALSESRAHGGTSHPAALHLWPSHDIGVIVQDTGRDGWRFEAAVESEWW